jgi:hypothetical protein
MLHRKAREAERGLRGQQVMAAEHITCTHT